MNESISYLKSCASKLLAHASDVERARVTCNGICMSAYAAHLRTPITNAPASDTRCTSIDGVNARHERALHSSAPRSGHQCLLGQPPWRENDRQLDPLSPGWL